MSVEILMPALSPTMEEGNLAKWHVKVGDKVESGQVIAEIETDKATMEVEAVDEGRIGQIVVPEGSENVKVNSVIAVLLQDGEEAPAQPDAPKAEAPKPEAAKPEAPAAGALMRENPATQAATTQAGPPTNTAAANGSSLMKPSSTAAAAGSR